MNEEELKQYSEKVEEYSKKYANNNKGLPEAGGVAYCTLYSSKGVALNITARGVNPVRAAESLIECIGIISPVYKLSPDRQLPPATPPTPPADVKIVMEAGNKEMAKDLQKNYDDVGAPPAGKEWITFLANVVKVLPQPDNKVTLEFYAEGKKFPGVKVNKWKVESANGLMKHVTADDMSKAAEYKLDCIVYYTEGAEGKTADGKVFHWKDVSHVRPLPF